MSLPNTGGRLMRLSAASQRLKRRTALSLPPARHLREAGSVQREVDGRRDRERRGGDKCRRVKWIEFRLPHDHGEACPQECRGQEERMADRARGAPAPACQPTMTRAPASKEES